MRRLRGLVAREPCWQSNTVLLLRVRLAMARFALDLGLYLGVLANCGGGLATRLLASTATATATALPTKRPSVDDIGMPWSHLLGLVAE